MQHNTKINYIFYLLIAVLFLSACSKADKDQYFENYFPLQVGNTWIYNQSYYYPASSDTALSTRQVRIKIIKDTIIENGQLAYVVEEQTDNNSYSYIWYVAGTNFIEQQMNGSKMIKYKLSMQKGNQWLMFPDFPNQADKIKEVISVFEKYEFLNTSAQAFEIRFGNPRLNEDGEYGELSTEIFAPRIGLLESDYQINFFGPSRTHSVLTGYYTE